LLAYIDQSTMSELACSDRCAATRELLQTGVQAGKLICPESLGHTDETLAATRSWPDILDLQDELSMGIRFRDEMPTAQYEAISAVAQFCGEPAPYSFVDEAFRSDPHAHRDELFPGDMRVRVRPTPNDYFPLEVAHEKAKEHTLQKAYDAARALGRSFDEQAEAEYGEMVYWVLGPLTDPDRFGGQLARKKVPLVTGGSWEIGPGSAVTQYTAAATRLDWATHLAKRYPAMEGRWGEFAASHELRHMPALRYPALFRAALATMHGRKAKKGDGYDIAHLTRGLSRCDIVTADAGMTQIVRDRRIVPAGRQLFSFREMAELHRAVDAALVAT
jgi:hypothetical protein